MQAAVLALAPGATDATHLMTVPAITEASNQSTNAFNDYGVAHFFVYVLCAILILLPYVGYRHYAMRHCQRYLRRGAACCIFFLYATLPKRIGFTVRESSTCTSGNQFAAWQQDYSEFSN